MPEVTPYICVSDARAAVDWYVSSLGGTVTVEPMVMDDGRVGHAEVSFDGARVMMSDPHPEIQVEPPAPGRGSAVTLYLAVPDCRATTERAVTGGATLDRGPEENDRGWVAVLRDPFGHRWYLHTDAAPTG